jgi:hypothetical protein
MAKWVKLTHHAGADVWVNLDVAAQIIRHEGHDITNISVGSGNGLVSIVVNETPAQIWAAASHQTWG